MPRPRRFVRGRGGTCVHTERPVAGGIRFLDAELQLHRTVLSEHKRCLKGKFPEVGAADLIPCAYCELQECSARYDDRARHTVLGQPRLRPGRETPGQYHLMATGQGHRRTQERVLGRGKTDR